jgi:HK97 family phage prohead protease
MSRNIDTVSPRAIKLAIRVGAREALATFKRQSTQTQLLMKSTVKNAGGGRYTFIISSSSVDREKDVVDVHGIDLDNFKINPVVLWAHNSSLPPIARAANIRIAEDKLLADVIFPELGTSKLADEVRGLVEQGFVGAASIGFQPIEMSFNDAKGGFDFHKIELHEFSLVPVPANSEATIRRALRNTEVDKEIVRQVVREALRV